MFKILGRGQVQRERPEYAHSGRLMRWTVDKVAGASSTGVKRILSDPGTPGLMRFRVPPLSLELSFGSFHWEGYRWK